MKQKIQTKQIRVLADLLEEVRGKLVAIHHPVQVSERETVDAALRFFNEHLSSEKKSFPFWRKKIRSKNQKT